MQFNARVHYTVLTQHPTPTNNQKSLIMTIALRVGYNQGIMPQTPNNAPSTINTHQKCLHVSQSTILVKMYLHPIKKRRQQNNRLLNHHTLDSVSTPTGVQ